jgi:hypothetical protein
MNHSPGKRGRKVTGAREVQLRLGVQGGFFLSGVAIINGSWPGHLYTAA